MLKPYVLVVEDEAIIALDIQNQLRNLGYTVSGCAASGEEAIDQAARTRPDLVLMDIKLKGKLDGIQAAEQIQARFNIPVVYLTTYADDATLQRARMTTPYGYLLKPFEGRELHITIEVALCRRRTEQKLAAIYQLGQELVLLHDTEAIIRRVLATALNPLSFEWVGGGLVDETTDELNYYYQPAGAEVRATRLCLPLDDESDIVAAVLRSGQVVNLADMSHPAPQASEGMGWTARSGLGVPIKIDQRILGVINVASSQSHYFTLADQQLLQTLANQVAIVLENVRLYQAEQDQFHRLQKSQADLMRMEKMALLGRLATSIAHEINNPIQALQNALTLIKEGLAKQQREKLDFYLDITENEAQRIATAVRGMLDFYYLSRRRQQLNLDADVFDDFYSLVHHEKLFPFDLHLLLESVLKPVREQFQYKGIEINYFPATDLPHVMGSPDHLKHVFLNLVLNAMEAMANQGGVLSVQTWRDEVEGHGDQRRPAVRIELSDTGVGIPPNDLPHLFEPFFTTKRVSTSFGLFTNYKIIEAHSGQMQVQSQPGEGTTFIITLPLALVPYQP